MSEAVKEKFDKDRNSQEFIEKLPEIFMSVQNLSTKSPVFEVGGYQLGHEFQSQTFATITSTVPQTNLRAGVPIKGEEEENIVDIN